MLGIADLDMIAVKCPPLTEEEAELYLAGDSSVRCTAERFRIDFVRQWKRFAFNKEAREIFIDNFLGVSAGEGLTREGGIPEALLNRETVGRVLDTYIDRCRRKFKAASNAQRDPRPNEDALSAEARVEEALRKENEARRKAAKGSRRATVRLACSI